MCFFFLSLLQHGHVYFADDSDLELRIRQENKIATMENGRDGVANSSIDVANALRPDEVKLHLDYLLQI